MSRGLGRIEQVILDRTQIVDTRGELRSVLLDSWELAFDRFWHRERDWDWEPSLAQRKAVTQAMHSFVRKFPQYALIGGHGRKRLFLYEPADPLSAMWAKLRVEHREFVSRSEAQQALTADG